MYHVQKALRDGAAWVWKGEVSKTPQDPTDFPAHDSVKYMLSTVFRRLTLPSRGRKHSVSRTMGTVYPTTKSTATDLLSILPQKFETAKTSGELFFFPSTSRDIHSEGRRVCASQSYENDVS
jgi:hypothetical protein